MGIWDGKYKVNFRKIYEEIEDILPRNHKSLEERAKEFGGKLNLDGEWKTD